MYTGTNSQNAWSSKWLHLFSTAAADAWEVSPNNPLWHERSFPTSFCVKNAARRSFRKNSSLPSTFYRYLHLDNLRRRKVSSWGCKMEENWNGKWNKSFCFDLWVITAEANISIQNAPLVYVARMFCHQNLGGVNWNLSCGFCGTLICFLNLIYFRAEGLNSWR